MPLNKHIETDSSDDPWEAIVSAWADGEEEFRPEDLDSPYGRQVWDTYHLIGDVLRTPELAVKPSDLFYARISKAIDAEPTIIAPGNLRRRSGVRMGLSGLAVAAAVASVVWVAMPYFVPMDGSVETPRILATSEDSGLRDYLSAHQEIAGASPVRQVSFGAGRQ
ncbi:sigma-E factor negative regulatory protein [Alcaligenaceae bacterium]|nr:sigma-E factor negative regulatory protein [Alcaligenaceae bacterium]